MQKFYKILLSSFFLITVFILAFFYTPDHSVNIEAPVQIAEETIVPPVDMEEVPKEHNSYTSQEADEDKPTGPAFEPGEKPTPAAHSAEPTSYDNTEEPKKETPTVSAKKEATLPNTVTKPKQPACTLSVLCDDILKHPEKQPHVPESGIILEKKQVDFTEHESVFDVLKRELANSGIPMEFTITPIYNTAYVEGIANIYEFDYGDTSGWMYTVNGKTPTYGCSQYMVQDGDDIVFFYRCSLY